MNKHPLETSRVVFLEGDKIIFRPLDERDLDRIVIWINDPQVRKYLTVFIPMTMGAEKKWIESISGSEKNIVLAAIDKETGKHIGNAGLHNINGRNRTATFGFLIGDKDFWGKGYGTEMLDLMLKYAFHTLGLRKVKSSVLAANIGSAKVHEKCGYKKAGVFKNEYLVDGEYVDEILLDVLREDWEKK